MEQKARQIGKTTEFFAKRCQEIINQGICKGDCCGNTILPMELIEKNRDKFQVKSIKESKADFDEGPILFCETEDDKCVFLNRETIRCMIYKDRPDICKRFGLDKNDMLMQCPFLKPNGNIRSPAKQRRYQRINRDKVKNSLEAIGRQLNYKEVK